MCKVNSDRSVLKAIPARPVMTGPLVLQALPVPPARKACKVSSALLVQMARRACRAKSALPVRMDWTVPMAIKASQVTRVYKVNWEIPALKVI